MEPRWGHPSARVQAGENTAAANHSMARTEHNEAQCPALVFRTAADGAASRTRSADTQTERRRQASTTAVDGRPRWSGRCGRPDVSIDGPSAPWAERARTCLSNLCGDLPPVAKLAACSAVCVVQTREWPNALRRLKTLRRDVDGRTAAASRCSVDSKEVLNLLGRLRARKHDRGEVESCLSVYTLCCAARLECVQTC
ncbi:hypothetical protein MRX96_027785 [Rhipicephalus microplus]